MTGRIYFIFYDLRYICPKKLYTSKINISYCLVLFVTKCDSTTVCPDGWFGLDFKQKCSGHCRDSSTCDYVTGQCNGGCVAGRRNSVCKKSDVFIIYVTNYFRKMS